MQMEFLYKNYFNTSTLATVGSGTDSVANMFDRDSDSQYATSGKNNDAVGATIGIVFPSSKNIDRIVLQNINLKSFKIYHSSNGANTFTLSTTAETNTTEWSTNSTTSLYLVFATTAVSSIWIEATATIVAAQEKKIGDLTP